MKKGVKTFILAGLLLTLFVAFKEIDRIVYGHSMQRNGQEELDFQNVKHLVIQNVDFFLSIDNRPSPNTTLKTDSLIKWDIKQIGDTLHCLLLGHPSNVFFLQEIQVGNTIESITIKSCRDIHLDGNSIDSLEVIIENSNVRIDEGNFHLISKNSKIKNYANLITIDLDYSQVITQKYGGQNVPDFVIGTLTNGSYFSSSNLGDSQFKILDGHSKIEETGSINWTPDLIEDSTSIFAQPITKKTILYASLTPSSDHRIDQLMVFSNGPVYDWNDYAAGFRFSSYAGYVDLSAKEDGRIDSVKVPVTPEQTYDCWMEIDPSEKLVSMYVKTPAMTSPILISEKVDFKQQTNIITRWSIIHNKSNTDSSMEVYDFSLVDHIGEYPALIN